MRPAGGLCEIVSTRDPAAMAGGREPYRFAAEHQLVTLTIADLVAHRLRTERLVERGADVALPTRHGPFRGIGYRDTTAGDEHLAVLAADTDLARGRPVHVHHECLVGDVFGGTGCRCSRRLDAALSAFGQAGHGLIVYLRSRRPRPCREPDAATGAPPRSEHVAAAVVEDLGVRRAALLHADHGRHAAMNARDVATTDADVTQPGCGCRTSA